MFHKLPPHMIKLVASRMELRKLQKNEIILNQDEPCDGFFLLGEGEIKRRFVDPKDGKMHKVEFEIKAKSINSMRVISGDRNFATVKCASDSCKLYEMKRDQFLDLLKAKPDLAINIAEGLCEQIRIVSKKYRTPLLEQKQQGVNIPAIAIAAGIESYYRSALNATLNRALTGAKAELFPNMHIQVPTRIAYICGFKGLRGFFDEHVKPEEYNYPGTVNLAAALAPGILMTPISSVLEASNAGHMNPESMTTRWMRGAIPRCGREIIFGLGLNQLSDYFEERLTPFFRDNPLMANAAGSLAAGVVSGYLSHVPHNISTFKLLQPERSYGDLYQMFVDKSVPPVIDTMVESWPATTRNWTRTLFATLFPKGLIIRTTQIVGSFIILNGTINYLQVREHRKLLEAMEPPKVASN